jgi:hypothetical protein
MPHQRFTFVPHPIAGMPASICREYLQGNDPITGKPVMSEIVEALTEPLSEEEQKTGIIEIPRERLLEPPDTPENLEHLFLENGWTDYMPIILPTQEKVAEMLKGTSRSPDESVGSMHASGPHPMWSYTVEMVAVSAVMAGARPEYFPVILAIASTGVTSLHTSTASFSRMVVVNGPIRYEIGMNTGIGALGPFSYANATIGRAWTILSKNLSGSGIPGENYMASLGCNMNYNNLCFPEKDEALPPGWSPLHVQKGFQPEDSVVSILTGYSMLRADTSFMGTLYSQLPYYLSSCNPTAGACMLMDPTIARKLKSEGFDTKEELIQWAWDNTKIKVDDYWNKYHFTRNFRLPLAEKGVEPYASWLELPGDSLIPHFRDISNINIIVVGGETNLFWKLGDHTYVTSAPVDKWR